MRRLYTPKELAEKLRNMTVICDTRENVNGHITAYLDGRNIPRKSRKLDVGDYSLEVDGVTFEDEIAVERKASLDEIAMNFTLDRERFEREFLRAKARGTKIFLLIENASWRRIMSHDYRSKLLPKSLIGSLLAWQARYGITVIFCEPDQTGPILHGLLYYWAKERFENG